jgi:hypothetical protein
MVRQVGTGSFYVVDDVRTDGDTFTGSYTSTEHTVGPWADDLQHAGPPTALLIHATSHLGGPQTPVPGRALPARVTAEILHPVPVAELVVRARVVRPGQRVALVQAALAPRANAAEPVMTASVWLVRRADVDLALPVTPRQPPPGPGTEQPLPGTWRGGYLHSVTWELAAGSLADPGPAATWTRLRVPLVDDAPTSGVERAAVVADAGSGISAWADPSTLVFVNTEITLHLTTEPTGEDVWMDSRTSLDPAGIGHVHTVLGDRTGSIGTADATLFVAPR